MIVAIIALVAAMGGTGYAALKLPKNSVGAKQIKKGAVSSSKVKDGSLKLDDFGQGQVPAGPEGPKGDPGASAVSFWAVVNADASLVRGSGVKSVGRQTGHPTGTYLVRFNEDISKCAYVATLGAGAGAGELAVSLYQVADTVKVETADSGATALADRNFHVIVAC
jgi:hypothetical protein